MSLKLHVGCGSQRKPGYVNIDAFDPAADLRIPIEAIDYPPNSVEIVEGYMVIEHLDRSAAEQFVHKAFAMLVPGGRLILECPDLVKVARLVLEFEDDLAMLEDGAFGFRGFFGEPKENMTAADYHKWGYSAKTLSALFFRAGFRPVLVGDGASHGYPIRDVRVEGVKPDDPAL